LIPGIVEEATAAIRDLEPVSAVSLVGSRRDGSASALSDWDFVIDSDDLERLAGDLPEVIGALRPLAALWDPLGEHRNYMAIFPGLVKLDLHLNLPPPPHMPWSVNADTLAELDTHFWDWTLWLAGKALKGHTALVSGELEKMHEFLLGPLGVEEVPQSIDAAVEAYRAGRSSAENSWSVSLPGSALESEVLPALERHGLITRRT
jgi:hypothetical protein